MLTLALLKNMYLHIAIHYTVSIGVFSTNFNHTYVLQCIRVVVHIRFKFHYLSTHVEIWATNIYTAVSQA